MPAGAFLTRKNTVRAKPRLSTRIIRFAFGHGLVKVRRGGQVFGMLVGQGQVQDKVSASRMKTTVRLLRPSNYGHALSLLPRKRY